MELLGDVSFGQWDLLNDCCGEMAQNRSLTRPKGAGRQCNKSSQLLNSTVTPTTSS